ADDGADTIVAKAGYNPAAALEVLDILGQHSTTMPTWLSTHPNIKERKANVNKWLAAHPNAYQPGAVRAQQVAYEPPKRTIVIQLDGALADPLMARMLVQAMGQSSKINVVAYGGDREEIKRAQAEFGITPDFKKPQDIWLVGGNIDPKYASGGASISTPWGGIGYYKNGDRLIASLVATPYNLTTGQLRSREVLIANGEARIASGSSTSVWLPQGGFNMDTQRARGYPQGEAFYQAALKLRTQFEALPVETVTHLVASSEEPDCETNINPGRNVSPGDTIELWTKTNPRRWVGDIKVIRVEGRRVFCKLLNGEKPNENTDGFVKPR
ncbi:hypothetical protein HY065_02010, partial [Candidatus Berkelbacteria bacterium]|nr:hypothetical protein [Candidatus Berkelbacteria bacterium]